MHQHSIHSVSLDDLPAIAASMVQRFPAPLVIGLVGTLGAGKTTLVQAIAEAAGIDVANVTSPTFTLLQTHQGTRFKLHHLDAYRLADENEFYDLGVDELFEEEAWTIVEWADRVAELMPEETLWIEIELTEAADCREVVFRTTNPAVAEITHKS